MDIGISICIPTWEQYGYGKIYLGELLESIRDQTFKDFDIIVSDHSKDEVIKQLLEEYKDVFNITYIRNEKNRGNGPANTNNSLRYARGKIIKIMFQDDLFVHKEGLEKIYRCFEEEKCSWLVNGCNHTNDGKNFHREMIPHWNSNILVGVNTISSPSVLSFLNDDISLFDEDLVMLMDCEYYYQLYKKYGLPFILRDILISNRIHSHQISTTYSKDINEEIKYVRNKYLW